MSFWLGGDEVDDNRIISMEIISVMSRCPWPNDTYHFQVTEHYQNYWHQVQHSKYQGLLKPGYNLLFPSIKLHDFQTWPSDEKIISERKQLSIISIDLAGKVLSKLFAIILDSFIENIVVLDIELKIAFGLGASHQIDYISFRQRHGQFYKKKVP